MVHLDWFHYHFSVYAILIVRATIRDTNCLTSCYNCPFQIKNVAQEYCIKRYSVCLMSGFVLSVSYVFQNVFKQHHRDRFNILLGKTVDLKGIGIIQTNLRSPSDPEWLGKGFL
jgi:hypothetical protein